MKLRVKARLAADSRVTVKVEEQAQVEALCSGFSHNLLGKHQQGYSKSNVTVGYGGLWVKSTKVTVTEEQMNE